MHSGDSFSQLTLNSRGADLGTNIGGTWTTLWEVATKSDLGNFLTYRGTFGGDFNDPNIIRGIYTINDPSSYTNGPKKLPGFCCFVHFGIYSMQLIINAKEIYTRKYTGNPLVWSDWATYIGAID